MSERGKAARRRIVFRDVRPRDDESLLAFRNTNERTCGGSGALRGGTTQ